MSKVSDALGEISSKDLDSLFCELHSTQQKYEAALQRINKLEDLLVDCANELKSTIDLAYPYRGTYKQEMRHWESDMAIVDQIYDVLSDKWNG